MLYFLYFFLGIIALGNICLGIYLLFSFWRRNKIAPYVGSFGSDLEVMKQLKLDKKKKLVDLGCGDGKALRFFFDQFGVVGVGYDINRLALFINWLVGFFSPKYRKIKLIRKNFMEIDISQFDYIYVFLLPEQLAGLENWLWKNMKSSAVIISNSFEFATHSPFEILKSPKGRNRVFLYRRK